MFLIQIFDAKGEPFEVRPDVARKLLIEDGWSMDAPGTTQAVEAKLASPAFAAPEVHEEAAVDIKPEPEPASTNPAPL